MYLVVQWQVSGAVGTQCYDVLHVPGCRWEGCALPWPAVFSKFSGLCACVHMFTIHFGKLKSLTFRPVGISYLISLCLRGGTRLVVMFKCTARFWVIPLSKQTGQMLLCIKWNHPGKVQAEATVLHNVRVTEPINYTWSPQLMTCTPHSTPAPASKVWRFAAIPPWLISHHFVLLNSLKITVTYLWGQKSMSFNLLLRLCGPQKGQLIISHLTLWCSWIHLRLHLFLSVSILCDLEPFVLLKELGW